MIRMLKNFHASVVRKFKLLLDLLSRLCKCFVSSQTIRENKSHAHNN